MDSLPDGILIVGGVLLLGLAAVIVAKYAKQILLFLALAVGVVILAAIAWAWLKSSTPASTEGAGGTLHDLADIARALAPKSEPVYQTPPPRGGGFVAGVSRRPPPLVAGR